MKIDPLFRFESKFTRGDGCWLWIASLDVAGYGKFWDGQKLVRASRFSYSAYVGPIPAGLCVLHRCDAPQCVNPSHLFIGTLSDNTQDMLSKNRHNIPRGEQAGKAKLTESNVLEIRRRYAAGGVTTRALALEFGVAASVIHGAIKGKYWAHLPLTEQIARAA